MALATLAAAPDGAEDGVSVNAPMHHPGPVAAERVSAVETPVVRFGIELTGQASLEEEILSGFARAGLGCGAVEIAELECEALDYVIPARSEFPDRLAWYSAPRAPRGAVRILRGYASVGRDGDAGMIHCHGVWSLEGGRLAMGHLLGRQTRARAGQRIGAIGFAGAAFDRRPDPETNFDLFAAIPTGGGLPAAGRGGARAVVATLRPNVDIAAACRALCARFGLARARVIGLGSLNGAGFEGDSAMQDHASEFLIRQGHASPEGARLDIAVVDSSANRFAGVLAPGGGRVSITSELVLLEEDGAGA